jgi:lysyl-tRNA synthetase class 2
MARNLHARDALLTATRAFFADRGFLQVDTPVRIPCPANEDYIDAPPAGDQYLRTSPELHMKRMLAAGYERLFQIGPCFRSGERGRRHLPEFTMLEWYRADAGYLDILEDCKALVARCADAVESSPGRAGSPGKGEKRSVLARAEWQIMTVDEAFAKHAATSLGQAVESGCFEQVLVEEVEPNLGRQSPTVLLDYPSCQASLARECPGNPARVERWELYIDSLEIANAYGELTDPKEQERRFADSAELRRREGREAYPPDREFMEALTHGLPPCAGVALGVDRLLMALLGESDIHSVVPFPPAVP